MGDRHANTFNLYTEIGERRKREQTESQTPATTKSGFERRCCEISRISVRQSLSTGNNKWHRCGSIEVIKFSFTRIFGINAHTVLKNVYIYIFGKGQFNT